MGTVTFRRGGSSTESQIHPALEPSSGLNPNSVFPRGSLGNPNWEWLAWNWRVFSHRGQLAHL